MDGPEYRRLRFFDSFLLLLLNSFDHGAFLFSLKAHPHCISPLYWGRGTHFRVGVDLAEAEVTAASSRIISLHHRPQITRSRLFRSRGGPFTPSKYTVPPTQHSTTRHISQTTVPKKAARNATKLPRPASNPPYAYINAIDTHAVILAPHAVP